MKEIKLAQAKAGDFILVKESAFLSRMIQLGQRLRVSSEFCWCNHAALLVGYDNTGWKIIESVKNGPQLSALSNYRTGSYKVISSNLDDEDRKEAVHFAYKSIGDHYGFLTIASIILNLLTPSSINIDFRRSRTLICSGLVARALEHGGVVLPKDPYSTMPADLAEWAGVK